MKTYNFFPSYKIHQLLDWISDWNAIYM